MKSHSPLLIAGLLLFTTSCSFFEGVPEPPTPDLRVDILTPEIALPTDTPSSTQPFLLTFSGLEDQVESDLILLGPDTCTVTNAPEPDPNSSPPDIGCIYNAPVGNFEITAEITNAEAGDSVGCILFGVQDVFNYYKFCVDYVGSQFLLVGFDMGAMFIRTDWTPFPIANNPFEMGVVLNELQFTGSINGEVVLEEFLSHYVGGKIGLGFFSPSYGLVSGRGEVKDKSWELLPEF